MSTTTSTLNDLIEVLKDGQEGFTSAAQDIDLPDLKSKLRQFAAQREQFATQLQVLARDFGDSNPTDSSSLSGTIHRGWINLKAALASRDAHAILAECERGEDYAVSAYEKATQIAGLPVSVTSVIHEQFADVKATHDQVKALRDSQASAK